MDNNKWLEHYRTDKSAIWLKVRLTDGQELFLNHASGWKGVKLICDKKKVFLEEFSLQFRSHEVKIDLEDAEGVYFVRSIMGQMGGASRHYYTVGIIKENKVHKTMWLVPELIEEKKTVDSLAECFDEMVIYDETKKENREK